MAERSSLCRDELTIRNMLPEEIPQAVDIWKEQELEEGEHSVDIWYSVDPEGFFVAVDGAGQVTGTCAGIRQHDDLYFVGMYAVRKKFQGQGVGPKIWSRMMQRVGSKNAGLNAVPKHLSTYRDRAGFSTVETWQTRVYGTTSVTPENLPAELDGYEVTVVSEDLIPQLVSYDADVHGFDRARVVSRAVTDTDGVTRAVVNTDSGEVCGFGMFSSNIQGGAIGGPVYADDKDIAGLLLRRLVEDTPSSKTSLTMMVIDCNVSACEVVEELGLSYHMEVPRCYRKDAVPAEFKKIYAQHDLNFSVF